MTAGTDKLGSYNKTPNSIRKWCTQCGGHVLTEHPTMGISDVYAAIIPSLQFQPGVHVNYQETVLRIDDPLMKLKELLKEMGGSGQVVAA